MWASCLDLNLEHHVLAEITQGDADDDYGMYLAHQHCIGDKRMWSTYVIRISEP